MGWERCPSIYTGVREGGMERGCPCLLSPSLARLAPGLLCGGVSPLTAPLSVSLSLSPLQSAQRLEEAPEETASEWLPSRWFLSKPLFQPAPGFVHTRSGCSRRGMELGTPGIQQKDHGDPVRCLKMCRLAAWGVWQDMGRFRKPLGPQTLCPLWRQGVFGTFSSVLLRALC